MEQSTSAYACPAGLRDLIMPKVRDYRRRAEEARQMAMGASSEDHRKALLKIAAAYDEMAQQLGVREDKENPTP
jgi:hypothetical protein